MPTTIIKSANSSTAKTIKGNSSKLGASSPSGASLIFQVGSFIDSPAEIDSAIFLLKPFKFLTPRWAMSLYLLSISFTHHLRPFEASFISVITGASKCGISSYTDNSSILGSIKIKRTCSGLALYKILMSIALIATDFPEPVVPATSKWGIEERSATIAEPLMSFPRAMVKGLFESS